MPFIGFVGLQIDQTIPDLQKNRKALRQFNLFRQAFFQLLYQFINADIARAGLRDGMKKDRVGIAPHGLGIIRLNAHNLRKIKRRGIILGDFIQALKPGPRLHFFDDGRV